MKCLRITLLRLIVSSGTVPAPGLCFRCCITDRHSLAGPAPTTLLDNRDRSTGPVHSSGWLSVAFVVEIAPEAVVQFLAKYPMASSAIRADFLESKKAAGFPAAFLFRVDTEGIRT